MNIMLATVTERTREIGIRRALGARRRDIVRQFLVETIALSVVGGLTGVLFGLICRSLSTRLAISSRTIGPHLMENLPAIVKTVTPEVVPASIPLAFGISVVVGVVFGLYPAIRAAQMDPSRRSATSRGWGPGAGNVCATACKHAVAHAQSSPLRAPSPLPRASLRRGTHLVGVFAGQADSQQRLALRHGWGANPGTHRPRSRSRRTTPWFAAAPRSSTE